MKAIIYFTLVLFLIESCNYTQKDNDSSYINLTSLENGLVRLYIPETIWDNYDQTVEETGLLEDSILHYFFSNETGQLDVSTDVNLSNSDIKYLMEKELETIVARHTNNKIYYSSLLNVCEKQIGFINYKKIQEGKVLEDNWCAIGLSNSRKKIVRIKITYSMNIQLKDSVSKILSSIQIVD